MLLRLYVCVCVIGFGTWQTVSVRMVDEEEEALLREEEARNEIEDAKQATVNIHQSKVLSSVFPLTRHVNHINLPFISPNRTENHT